jgi:tetratricopeptide (TPR) repeat protein
MLPSWRSWVAPCVTLALVLGVIGFAAWRAGRAGAAYRPRSADEIVLTLSAARAAEATEARALRARLREAAGDVETALRLARAEIERSRESGDQRPLGRAEALLAAFAKTPSAPVLVLRATIAQARHQFTAALADLDAALKLDASDPQAHLTRASLLGVLGRYAEARESCAPLAQLAPAFVVLLCRANLDVYTAQRPAALTALQQALSGTHTPGQRAWVLSVLCEQAFWSAELDPAARYCRSALMYDAGDRYTRALYADVLLQQGAFDDVLTLVPEDSEDDALLLRRALALLSRSREAAAGVVQALRQRFAQSRDRGDRVHQREEARLLLALGDEPARVLQLAREGFAAQREPWDLRLLIEAAQAAHDPRAAAPVRRFMRENAFVSRSIDEALVRLGSAS